MWFFVLLSFVFGAVNQALAVQTHGEESELGIPTTFSMPPHLSQKKPPVLPHCERYFIYSGKKFECDSNLGKDAVQLRSIISSVPDALAELDSYQETRVRMTKSAYVGSTGLMTAVAGFLISRPLIDQQTHQLRTGGYLVAGGLTVAFVSMIYAFTSISSNDSHLLKAVEIFNTAHPENPIEIQFSTQFHF
jgi:hypothetical protein